MVPSIARQSVIIKCNQQTSVLLGNYEFYYLAGLMKKIFELDLSEELEPQQMKDKIMERVDNLASDDPREAYLLKMVKNYKPLPEYDDQTRELFRWGAGEEYMWQVNIG